MFLDAYRRHHRISVHAIGHAGPHSLVLAGLIFASGVAVGLLFPWHHQAIRADRNISVIAQSDARTPRETMWPRTGNGDVRHPVEVIRTIDGDTFEAQVHLWPGLDMTTRVRLRGVDAPELNAACSGEYAMARTASELLQATLAEGGVTISNIGPDKYNGRVVADAATRTTPNISAALLASGLARAYDGGHRGGWCDSASR